MIPAFQAGDPGSIPGRRILNLLLKFNYDRESLISRTFLTLKMSLKPQKHLEWSFIEEIKYSNIYL